MRNIPRMAGWLLLWLSAGCGGVNMAAVRKKVEQSPYRRVAAISFADAPGAPGSGRMASDLFARQLQRAGYELVSREDNPELLLSGTVAEEYVAQETRPTFCGDGGFEPGFYGWGPDWGLGMGWDYPGFWGPDSCEETVDTAVFSLTARLTRLDTGMPVWIGYGASQQEGGTLQQAAESAVKKAADKLFRAIDKHRKR